MWSGYDILALDPTKAAPSAATMSALSIRGHGLEIGGEGMPSSLNPFLDGTSQHRLWRDAHFEGQCAAIDAGEIPAP